MENKTSKVCGVSFNIVNELPQKVTNKLIRTVKTMKDSDYQGFEEVETILRYISGGVCGKIYDLGGDFILKINEFSWNSNTYDGDILRDLQGIPLIPKVYWYSDDNRFIVIQKINGRTVRDYFQSPFILKKQWVHAAFKEIAEKTVSMCLKRGWVVNDMHSGNCMIDYLGEFWIVDVGLFKKTGNHDYLAEHNLIELISESERIEVCNNMMAEAI